MRVISDIHLGSEACESDLIIEFLNNYDGPLVIAGDLFDSYNFKRFKKKHWIILEMLRKRKDITFVVGNHEINVEKAKSITGLPFVGEFYFESGKKEFKVSHGHEWDDFVGKFPLLENFADYIYLKLQKLDKRHHIAKKIKKKMKKFIHCIEKVSKGALSIDISGGVIHGHTHYPTHIHLDGRNYWNSGSWVEKPGTYVEIINGVGILKDFE